MERRIEKCESAQSHIHRVMGFSNVGKQFLFVQRVVTDVSEFLRDKVCEDLPSERRRKTKVLIGVIETRLARGSINSRATCARL